MLRGLAASSILRRQLPDGVTEDQAVEWTRTHLEGQRLLLASIAFLAWDWTISLDAEQEFIWQKSPWSVTKVLFVINRYFPILHSIARFWSYTHEHDPRYSDVACGPILDLAAYGSVISVAAVEIVLMLRLWAMYARSKIFGAFLVFLFLAGFGTALAIRKVQPPDDFRLVHEPPPALTVCKRSSPSELFFLYAIVLLVETTIFALLLHKVWRLSSVGIAPILKTMLKHGTQYYLIVFLALFFQVLGTILQPLWQPMADSLLVVAIASVACSRLVLSLRGMYTAPKHVTTIQDFQARSGVTGDLQHNHTQNGYIHTSRAIRLSTLRSPTSSKPFVDSSFFSERGEWDRDRDREGCTSFDRAPERDRMDTVSPIHEDDEDESSRYPEDDENRYSDEDDGHRNGKGRNNAHSRETSVAFATDVSSSRGPSMSSRYQLQNPAWNGTSAVHAI